MFGGAWNNTSSSSSYRYKVGSSYKNMTNNYVCADGANSGEHCAIKITVLNDVDGCPGNPQYTCKFHVAVRGSSFVAAAEGDSGGGVYANRDDGRVSARGIVSGIANPVPCGSMRFPSGNDCGDTLAFIPIATILDYWGVTIDIVA